LAHQLISATSNVDIHADPKETLVLMDRCGVDAAVIVPLAAESDCRSHNDWLAEFCSADVDRLWGVAQIPATGLVDAVSETRRMGSNESIVGFLLTTYPHGDETLNPEDDEYWSLVQEMRKPTVIRGGLGPRGLHWRPPENFEDAVTFDDVPGRQIEMLFAGVLQRFPDLKFVLSGVDCGWVPYFEYLANDNYLRHSKATLRDRPLPELPSRIFAKHFGYAFGSDPYGLANRDRIGLSRMMWSTDLADDTSSFDQTSKSLSELDALSPQERRAVVSENALRIFGRGSSEATIGTAH
jgi:predicted TIM-barrel fold metal-dependent hydrolase